jgi:hypothetical protein
MPLMPIRFEFLNLALGPSLRPVLIKIYEKPNENAVFADFSSLVARCVPYTYKMRNERSNALQFPLIH